MGCDIHLYVEKRNVTTRQWEAVKGVNEPEIEETLGIIENCKARGSSTDYWERRLEELRTGTTDFIWEGRHYLLFEVLAGVRAGHEILPISPPKGLPEDISPEANESTNGWGCDGHSHSYLSVSELKAYNWDQMITREGWVNVYQFKEFMENGEPSAWCGGVSGGGTRHISNREMKEGIKNGFMFGDPQDYFTLIHWNKPLRKALGTFCSWSLPKLNEMAGDDPESVRIVFWFDN